MPVGVDDILGSAHQLTIGVKGIVNVERIPGEGSLRLGIGPSVVFSRCIGNIQIVIIHHLVVVCRTGHLVLFGNGRYSYGCIEVQVSLAGFSALGSDDDHTVGGAGAIQGSGGGILQHRDGLNVLGVDAGQDAGGGVGIAGILGIAGAGGGHTVNHIQRIGRGIERACTTDAEGSGRTRLTGSGAHLQTGHLALQGLLHGRHGLLGQFLGTHHGGRSGIGTLLGCTIGDYNGLVNEFSARRKFYVQILLALHRNLHGFVSDGGEDKDTVRSDGNGVGAVKLGDNTCSRAAYDNGCTGNRIARLGIRDRSFHRDILRCGRKAHGQEQDRE